jgi:hypothetical protein
MSDRQDAYLICSKKTYHYFLRIQNKLIFRFLIVPDWSNTFSIPFQIFHCVTSKLGSRVKWTKLTIKQQRTHLWSWKSSRTVSPSPPNLSQTVAIGRIHHVWVWCKRKRPNPTNGCFIMPFEVLAVFIVADTMVEVLGWRSTSVWECAP